METRDFYVVLGVDPAATPHDLRDAYRHLALRYHPDRAGPHSTPFFQDVVEAYRMLSDPALRASYDEGLRHARGAPAPASRIATAAGPAPEPLVPQPISLEHDFEVREPSVEEVLERIQRNFTGRHVPKSERLDPLDLEICISPDLAAFGGTISLSVPVFFPCPRCHGEGHDGSYSCLACDRTGMIEEEQPVRLRIPPLSHDGDAFELPLRGLGIHNLYLRVRLRIES